MTSPSPHPAVTVQATTTQAARPPVTRPVVLVPTYNEAANVAALVRKVRDLLPDVEVCIVDDNSPDGTGAIADELAAADPGIVVLHRPGKKGLGDAYLHAFSWAAERGHDAVVEMDADGSHRPEDLPALLAAAADADVVIGSRWVPGGSVVNWPAHRKALSLGANLYTRVLLGMPVSDATAGFRLYRTAALTAMGLTDVASHGYCFQVDLTWRATRQRLRVVEVPIMFVERETGESKMSADIIRESLRHVTLWGLRYRAGQAAAAVTARRRGREGRS